MKFYELTHMLNEEMQEKLSTLVQRYKNINHWSEKEILQFAVTATAQTDMEAKFQFLEKHITQLEQERQNPKGKAYISEEERIKCKMVADAFSELEDSKVMILDLGKYGFVRLIYYQAPYGFDDAITYTDSGELFNDLWEDWIQEEVYAKEKDNPELMELDYDEILNRLPIEEQTQLMAKKEYFAQKAGIQL